MGAAQSVDEGLARIPRRERPLRCCEVYDREQHDAQWPLPPQSKDRVYLLVSLADAVVAAKETAVPKDAKCEFCSSADTAVVQGNSDPGDLSDASLLLSTQWSNTDKALLRARAMQRLASELSHLCREGDAFSHAVAQCTHALQCIHAAMIRAAAASKRSSTAAAVARQKALAASHAESSTVEANTPAGALIGARLLMTLLDLAEASSCTGLKQSEFVSEIATVLQSLVPLSLAVQQRAQAAVQTGQLSAAIVHRLRAFLYTASAAAPPRKLLRQQQQQHLHSAQWQDYQAMKLDSLAALTSLACARGRASDLLLLVKALLCIDEQQQQQQQQQQQSLRRSSAEHPVNSTAAAAAAAAAVKRRERSPSLTVRSKAGSKPVRLRASLSLPLEAADYSSEQQPEQSTAECAVSVVRVWDSEKAIPTAAAAAVATAAAVAAPQKPALSSSDKKDKWKKRERAAAALSAAAASDPTAVGGARQHSAQGSSSSSSSSSKHAAQSQQSPRAQPLPPQPAPHNGAALLLQLQAVSTAHTEAVTLTTAAAAAAAAAAAVRRPARRTPTEVWTCGQNSYGELGFGDAGSRTEPGLVKALQGKDVVDVAAGNEHTVVVLRSGVLLTAGYNDNGQCATGSTQRVGALTPVAALAGAHCTQAHSYNGCEHTLVVLKDGGLVAFGYNYRQVLMCTNFLVQLVYHAAYVV
jgi:Regulator of chromosome condensation (RCC1) repeat